jgi:hypothetical protein
MPLENQGRRKEKRRGRTEEKIDKGTLIVKVLRAKPEDFLNFEKK